MIKDIIVFDFSPLLWFIIRIFKKNSNADSYNSNENELMRVKFSDKHINYLTQE